MVWLLEWYFNFLLYFLWYFFSWSIFSENYVPVHHCVVKSFSFLFWFSFSLFPFSFFSPPLHLPFLLGLHKNSYLFLPLSSFLFSSAPLFPSSSSFLFPSFFFSSINPSFSKSAQALHIPFTLTLFLISLLTLSFSFTQLFIFICIFISSQLRSFSIKILSSFNLCLFLIISFFSSSLSSLTTTTAPLSLLSYYPTIYLHSFFQ